MILRGFATDNMRRTISARSIESTGIIARLGNGK